MPDTTAKPSFWGWMYQLVPTFNTVLTALAGIAIGALSTHFGPTYVGPYLPGKTEVQKVALSPSIEQLHDRVIKMEGDMKLVADWVTQQQMKIPARPVPTPAPKAKQ